VIIVKFYIMCYYFLTALSRIPALPLLKIVHECGILRAKPSEFPMEENHKIGLATGYLLLDASKCHHLVGRLIYLTITCPDQCISDPNSCNLLLKSIRLQHVESYNTLKAHHTMESCLMQTMSCSYLLIMIQIGVPAQS